MKKFIINVLAATMIIIFVPSCKKEPAKEQTVQQKLAGKWMIESIKSNEYYSGSDHIIIVAGTVADYMDFHTDGKVYTNFSGSSDVMDYSFPNEAQMIIDGESFTVKTFTQNSLVLYMIDAWGGISGEYDEITITLKR